MAEENEFEAYIKEQEKQNTARAGIYEDKVSYAFTMEGEVEKSLKLLPGEAVGEKMKVFFAGRISYLIITDQRLIFLRHRLIGADNLLYIPFSGIQQIGKGKHIYFQYGNKVSSLCIATIGYRRFTIDQAATQQLYETLQRRLPHVPVSDALAAKAGRKARIVIMGIVIAIVIFQIALFAASRNDFYGEIDAARKAMNRGDYVQALKQENAALSMAGNTQQKATAHYWEGLTYYRMGDYGNAVAAENLAVSLNPSNGYPYATLSAISLAAKNYQQAYEYAKQAVKQSPDYAWGHNDLGLALVFLGRKEEGIQELNEAISLSPDTQQFKTNLSWASQQPR